MPKILHGHSSLTLGNDLIVLGGVTLDASGTHYSSTVFKLSCKNGQFSDWIEMEVKLQRPREGFVASFTLSPYLV